MVGKRGNWHGHKGMHYSHPDAVKAIQVWVCEGCGLQDRGRYDQALEKIAPPGQCKSCGRLDFMRFDSLTEANIWANLRLQEKVGEISELRRQVTFPLMTVGKQGLPVQWAKYVADFVYVRDGVTIIGDAKPKDRIDEVAKLKFRCLEAAGIVVTVLSS